MAYNHPKVSLTLGSTRLIRHDMTPALSASFPDETITGVTVDDITDSGSATGHLGITAVAMNSVAYTPPCSQTAVAIAHAAEFSITSGHTNEKTYKLKITCVTTQGTIVDYMYVSFNE